MNRNNTALFSDGYLSDFLRLQLEKVVAEINRFDSDYILKVSLDDVANYLVENFHIEPISLQKADVQIGDSGDTTVDMSHDFRYGDRATHVPATFAEFVVPFTGNPVVFHLQPSTYSHNPPHAVIHGQELRLRFTSVDQNAPGMRAGFDNSLKSIEQFLEWGYADVNRYNLSLGQTIRQQLNNRRQKFLKDKGMVEALGFPIKPRNGVLQTYASPITRKRLPIQRPTVASGTYKPEPRLEIEFYEHILTVISNMVLVME